MRKAMRISPVITVIIGLLLGFGIMADSVRADFQRTKIAVLDFAILGDKMAPEGIGAILSEWFVTSIVQSGRFDVVERAMLQKIIAEQKLSTTGVVDTSTASQLGKILGVKVIITGSILKLGDNIDINARIIRVESGSIIAAENISGRADSDYHLMVQQLTAKIMQNFPLTGYIVKKEANSAIIDLGSLSGLDRGTEFIVYKEGAVIKHPKTWEVLDVEQIVTGRLRITKVQQNVSVGEILQEVGEGIEYGQLVKSELQKTDLKPITPPTGESATATAVAKPPPPPAPPKKAPVAAAPPPMEKKSLRAGATKKVLTTPSTPVEEQSNTVAVSPVVPQPKVPSGPRNHVAIFPVKLLKDGDEIDSQIRSRLPEAVTKTLSDLDRSDTFQFDNLMLDRSLAASMWNRYEPDVDAVVNEAQQRGIDYVLLYSFSFWRGQGLINGWGTDFQYPQFKTFLVDVANRQLYLEEDSNTTALDQLFIELRGKTKAVLKKTNFPR